MGYSYDQYGHLCCDVCGTSGGVRKYRCPFGYCSAVALCPECRRKHAHKVSKRYHRENGCERFHQEFVQHNQEKERLLAAGKFLRSSALAHDGKVKVIFMNKDRLERAVLMALGTYRAIALMDNATIEDFQAVGKLAEAKNCDIYDPN